MELAFAALQQLCAPMLDRLDRLPGPQRDALGVAFGLRAGDAPDRFLVGLAVLSLLADVAEEQPLMCVVDDAQWLDRASAQALVFVARRLLAESVALVLATREPSEELRGFPELVVEGLRNGDARALLGSVLRVPLDERVRERLVAETRGNPLALLELPRGLTPAELAGGFGLLDAPGLSGRIEESFRRRLEALPAETQRLLLVAAAEPVGDPVLVWRAAARLGIGVQAAAETDGLLTIGARVTFRHPLVRSAVYRAASPEDRQAAHRALADATDPASIPIAVPGISPKRRRGSTRTSPSELERSAGRAQARGGLAAAAAFLERATRLTLDPARRAERALAAAQAKHLAGAPDAALQLLEIARAGPLDELGSARVDLLRAQIAFASSHGSDAPPLLLAAAKRLEPLDIALARATYLDALSAGQFAGRLAGSVGAREVATAALAAQPPPHPPRASDLLLDGLATRSTAGYAAAAPMIKRALHAFRSENISSEEELRSLWLACRHAGVMWDDESWDVLTARHLKLAREAGALTVLPLGLNIRIAVVTFAGELATAASLAEELRAVTEATGGRFPPYAPLLIGAFRGREAEALGLIEEIVKEVTARGEGLGLAAAEWARAMVYNGISRHERRAGGGRARRRASGGPDVLQLGSGRADRGGRP